MLVISWNTPSTFTNSIIFLICLNMPWRNWRTVHTCLVWRLHLTIALIFGSGNWSTQPGKGHWYPQYGGASQFQLSRWVNPAGQVIQCSRSQHQCWVHIFVSDINSGGVCVNCWQIGWPSTFHVILNAGKPASQCPTKTSFPFHSWYMHTPFKPFF